MKITFYLIVAFSALIITTACAPRYSCKGAIPGTKCATLSEIYNEEVLGAETNRELETENNNIEIVKNKKNNQTIPIRVPPRIIRIWIAPWEDENEDLNMGSYIYTEIERNKWIIGEQIPGMSHNGTYPEGNVGNITKQTLEKILK